MVAFLLTILLSKIRFFIPFHRNPIHRGKNVQIGILNWFWIVRSIWSIYVSIAFLIVCLHEPLTKSLKVTSTLGLPCENRSAFRLYVLAGQQSDPIFDWRIQIQTGQKECTQCLRPIHCDYWRIFQPPTWWWTAGTGTQKSLQYPFCCRSCAVPSSRGYLKCRGKMSPRNRNGCQSKFRKYWIQSRVERSGKVMTSYRSFLQL